MKRIIILILALIAVITLIVMNVQPASAASGKVKHCGVLAHWDGTRKDVDKETTTTIWWRTSDEASSTVQACVRSEDRKHTKKAINLDVYIVDENSREIHARGGNVVEALFTMNWETNAFIASGSLTKSHRESWVAWNR